MKTSVILAFLFVCQCHGHPVVRRKSVLQEHTNWKRKGNSLSESPLRPISGLAVPNEENPKYTDALHRFVVEALLRKKRSLSLTKGELELLFLEETGLEMSASMLDEMFNLVDVDKSGDISANDLLMYLQQLETVCTKRQRALAVSKTMLKDASWLMTLSFISGTTISLSTNILRRSGRHLPLPASVSPFRLSAWLFTVGTIGFTVQSYQREKNQLELNEQAKRVLFKWIKWTPWDKQRSAFLFKFGNNDVCVNRAEFQKILEKFSVFLPIETLDTLYTAIDKDRNGAVTKSNIEAFVVASQRNALDGFDKVMAVLSKCIRNWGFWSNFTWLVGSILFVVASYMTSFEGDSYTTLLQAGSVLYLFGGVSLLFVMYDEQFLYFSAIEGLQRAIHALAIPTTKSKGDSIQKSFRKLDFGGDGMLDSVELFTALQDAGIVIPLHLFLAVFREADKTSDGKLCLREFTDFVMSVDAKIFNNQMHPSRFVRKKMLNDRTFWLSSLFVLAGGLFTLESYGTFLGISDYVRSNMLLVGSFCYLINSFKTVVGSPVIAWRQHQIMEENNRKFKNGILASAQKYAPKRSFAV